MDRREAGSADGAAEMGAETWYLARRREFVTVFTILSVLMVVLAVAMLVTGENTGWDVAQAVFWASYAVLMAAFAWTHSRMRLQADGAGLHLISPLRTTTYPWQDVAEIRPSIVRGKRTFLVLVRRDRQIVDLPVTDEHLAALRRWHAAADHAGTSGP